jgi:uncharacterized protein
MKGLRHVHPVVFLPALAAVFLFFAAPTRAQSIASLPQPTDYVSDFAHVLSPEAIAHIDAICSQLDHSAANAQIAVVTVRTLDGDEAADYATQLYDKMKIGGKGSDRGVLILLAVDDRKRFIETGYGVEGILPDGKVGDIGRDMVPDLRAGDYDGAMTLAVGEIAQVIAADAKVTLTDNLPAPEPRPVHQGSQFGGLIFFLIILFFFGGFSLLRILFGASLFFGGWGRGGWRGGPFIGGGGFGGGGFGGGGFGGGGFGGGGGGFGGFGGGSTGGGGAGGSW